MMAMAESVYCRGKPWNGKTVGARNPKAINAAPMTPRPTLSQISATMPVMIAAEATTMAI